VRRLKAWLTLIGSELYAALGGGERNRWEASFLAFVSTAICVVTAYSIAWLGKADSTDSTRPERLIVVVLLLRFLFWLVVFHLLAWFVRRWVPKTLIVVLDYFYLGTAAVGLTASALRQEVEHSQYAALWFPTALPWLVAALALRLTKTSIELFGWYRRPAN
jgi:hypothetical protein